VVLGQVSIQSTSVLPSSCHYTSITYSSSPTCCSYQKKQTTQAWENSRKQQYSFGRLEALNRKVFSLFLSRFSIYKFHYNSTLQSVFHRIASVVCHFTCAFGTDSCCTVFYFHIFLLTIYLDHTLADICV